MTTMTHEHPVVSRFDSERRFLGELSAGTGLEAIAGAGALVLAIIGLAGVLPFYMAAIATIVVGAAFLVEGAVIMAKQCDIAAEFGETTGQEIEVGGGLSAEFAGGIAGIVLGILALVNVFPTVLLSVAALVLGGCMLVSSGATARTKSFELMPDTGRSMAREMARETNYAATGVEFLVALAAVVLGILAVVHIAPLSLALVVMLILGAAILLSGSALTTGMLVGWRRHEFPQT